MTAIEDKTTEQLLAELTARIDGEWDKLVTRVHEVHTFCKDFAKIVDDFGPMLAQAKELGPMLEQIGPVVAMLTGGVGAGAQPGVIDQ